MDNMYVGHNNFNGVPNMSSVVAAVIMQHTIKAVSEKGQVIEP